MRKAVIVDAVRTPAGRRNGKLKDWHPVDLAAQPLKALVERNKLDPAMIEDVIMGCVMQTGEQSLNVGRNAALAAGFPEDVVGTTIDRQCGSGQQAAHFAAQGVMAGVYDVVVAAGVESMTRVPMGITAQQGPGMPFGPSMLERYSQGLVPQGISAELIAEKWGITREELGAAGRLYPAYVMVALFPAMLRTLSSRLPALVRASAAFLGAATVAIVLSLLSPVIPPSLGFLRFLFNYSAILCLLTGLALVWLSKARAKRPGKNQLAGLSA